MMLSLHKDEFYLISNLLRQTMSETVPPVLIKMLRLMKIVVLFIDLSDLPVDIQDQFVEAFGK